MPPQRAIIFSLIVLGTLISPAAEIRWSARGAVSSVSGGAFSGTGVLIGQPVAIEMVYDSNT
jgi:hypothetical protein